jgi:hypothetical protein
MDGNPITSRPVLFKSRTGALFGLATLYGCLGWWLSSQVSHQWFDHFFIGAGIVIFLVAESVFRRISATWTSRLSGFGFVVTLVFIAWFSVKLYVDIAP